MTIFGSRPPPNFRIIVFRTLFHSFHRLRLLSIRSVVRELKHGNSQLQSHLKQLKAIGKPLLKRLAFDTMEKVLQMSIDNCVYLIKEKSALPSLENYDIEHILQKWRSSKIYERALLEAQSLMSKARRKKQFTKNRKKNRKQKSNLEINQQSKQQQKQNITKARGSKPPAEKNDLELKILELRQRPSRKDFKQARKDIRSHSKQTKKEKDFICRDYQIHPSWAAKLQREKLESMRPQGKAVKLC